MRFTVMFTAALTVVAGAGCSRSVDAGTRERVSAEIAQQVKSANDLTLPDAEQRMLALYPDTGRVVSTSAGHLVTSRDTLFNGIRFFWRSIGVNMKSPKWVWDQMMIDVLSPDAAVMTAGYHIPHLTPRNRPHNIRGAWTAVFRRQGTKWVIIQEHLSDVPAPPDSARAARDTT